MKSLPRGICKTRYISNSLYELIYKGLRVAISHRSLLVVSSNPCYETSSTLLLPSSVRICTPKKLYRLILAMFIFKVPKIKDCSYNEICFSSSLLLSYLTCAKASESCYYSCIPVRVSPPLVFIKL